MRYRAVFFIFLLAKTLENRDNDYVSLIFETSSAGYDVVCSDNTYVRNGDESVNTIDNKKLQIINVDNPAQLARKALDMFVILAKHAISTKGVFYVAIPGGHTPREFFELIGQAEIARDLPWKKIQLFWVDERCVKIDSQNCNYKLAADTFLPEILIPAENIHRISGENTDYNEAATDYEETIRNVFSLEPDQLPNFDLVILGMGPDGHIGSLLPNSYALFDTEDLVSVVYQIDGLDRITLTHPVMCAASKLLILISGKDKAEIVKEVLQGRPDEVKYPVHTLWPILDKVTWLIDKEAGKYL